MSVQVNMGTGADLQPVDEHGEVKPTTRHGLNEPNVVHRQEQVPPQNPVPDDPARPILPPPTIDPNDADFYSGYDDVLGELQELAESTGIDPAVFERINNHLISMQSMLNSGESLNLEAFLVTMIAVMGEMRAVLKEIGVTHLQNQNEMVKAKNDEKLKSILESLESMAQAKKGGSFGKIFGWIAMAATAVFLGSTMLASGGLSTPVVLAGISLMVGAVMQFDSTVLDGKMMKGMSGGNDQVAMGLTYAIMAITILLSMASAVSAAGGVSKVAENARHLGQGFQEALRTKSLAPLMHMGGKGAASGAGNTLDVVTEKQWLNAVNNRIQVYSFQVKTGGEMGRAGSNMYVAQKEKEAAYAEADLKMIEAALRQIEEVISMIQELLKSTNESEVATAEFVAEVIKMLKDAKINSSKALT